MPHPSRMFPAPTLRVRLVLFALALVPAVAFATEGEWKFLDEDDGVKVWKLEIPGVEMPGFRGQTVMAGTPEQVLAVLEDVDAHVKWMERCEESRIVRTLGEGRAIVYNRTGAPWPVWDRDVVVETSVTRSDAGKHIVQEFHQVDDASVPVPDRTVRMPKLEGKYEMVEVSPGKTRVDYVVKVDVGGSIPTWIAKRVASDMPVKTLRQLAERVAAK